jgi:hypothetical protein
VSLVADIEVRQPVPLRTLHGIELAAVGTWKASTGETTFTAEDFANAVAALDCPGVRNPVIKLGHQEEDSTGGVRWDGEPAVGWVANMRFDGAKMIGDLTGLPAWLADADENGLSVLAAAYPDRSIEIYRPFVCQIGHQHPSVITALSLLGVFAPGVGVLRSMQDVYAAFTETSGPQAVQVSAPILEFATSVFKETGVLFTTLAAAEPRELTDIEKRSGVDLDKAAEQWSTAVDELVDNWAEISADQREQLSAQIRTAVDDDPESLGSVTVDSAAAAILLASSMRSVAQQSAAAQVAEAKAQGVDIAEPDLTDESVRPVAEGVAAGMAASTASAAGRTAAQALGTGDGKHVAGVVDEFLSGLTDRFLRDQLGGALSAAQHIGRMATLSGYEGAVDLYASERNDTNACSPCKSIDGKRFETPAEADAAYGGGKYVGCAGGARCRGQLIAVFGSDRASARTTIRTTLGGRMGVVKASVSVEDISRQYYETAGYSMWITAMHVDPLELIAADDATGKYYRIPVQLGAGDKFEFGEAQEVAIAYQDVKAAASALPVRFGDKAAAFLAAGKNADGSDRVGADLTPAGAAIRKAMDAKATTAPAVLETDVPAPEQVPAPEPDEPEKTPDGDKPAGPTNPKEASVDAAKMREALGLGPDATDAEVAEAFSAQTSASATPPKPDASALLSALPKDGGAMLIDPENYKTLVAMAAKGQTAFESMQRQERDTVLNEAVRDGRFPVARLSTYSAMWDKDPAATKAYIELMPKNSVPVMASGFLGAEVSQNETDLAYNAMYPEATRG